MFQGLKAIHSPHTGIIDYGEVTRSYGRTFEKAGGKVYTNFEVESFDITKESSVDSKDGLLYPVTVRGDNQVKCLLKYFSMLRNLKKNVIV